MFTRIVFLILVLSLSACVSKPNPSPVVERPLNRYSTGGSGFDQSSSERKVHVVQGGDTLYNIALRHGLDVRQLAEINNITNPGELQIGQELYLQMPFPSSIESMTTQQENLSSKPMLYSISQPEALGVIGYQSNVSEYEKGLAGPIKTEPRGSVLPYSDSARAQLGKQTEGVVVTQQTIANAKESTAQQPASAGVNRGGVNWGWPVEGRIVSGFSDKSKGVGIGGTLQQPVLAAASGTVVYSGNGLRGYGNLIIIKHSDSYLSAYGHNSKILVHEGERVAKGQKIAEMGSADGSSAKLHFEIREKGKPVNPLGYLPAK